MLPTQLSEKKSSAGKHVQYTGFIHNTLFSQTVIYENLICELQYLSEITAIGTKKEVREISNLNYQLPTNS